MSKNINRGIEEIIKHLAKNDVISDIQRTINIVGNPPTKELGVTMFTAIMLPMLESDKKFASHTVNVAMDMLMETIWERLDIKAQEDENPCEGCHGCDDDVEVKVIEMTNEDAREIMELIKRLKGDK